MPRIAVVEVTMCEDCPFINDYFECTELDEIASSIGVREDCPLEEAE